MGSNCSVFPTHLFSIRESYIGTGMVDTIHKNPYDFWNSVVASVLSYGEMEFPKYQPDGERVPKPEHSGLFTKSIGEPKGQIADWRGSIPNSRRGIHVVEFQDRYSVHVDRFDPNKDPVRHLLMDSPRTIVNLLGAGLISLLFYGFFRRSRP